MECLRARRERAREGHLTLEAAQSQNVPTRSARSRVELASSLGDGIALPAAKMSDKGQRD